MSKTDKPTILIIIGSLGLGGAERQLFELINGLLDKYHFHVLTYYDGYWRTVLEKLHVSVEVVPSRNHLRLVAAGIQSCWRLQPTLVHTIATKANALGRLSAILTDRPVIVSERTNWKHKEIHYRLFDYILAGKTTRIIVNSQYSMNAMRHRVPKIDGKTTLIYNGIDAQRFKNVNSVSKQDVPTLVYVANYWPYKNHGHLVDTLALIVPKLPQVRCWLVGKAIPGSNIPALITERKLEAHVEMLGSRTDIETILASADIYVHPSLREGLSNSIMEAAASGLPCIVIDASSNAELVRHGQTGYVVPPDDMEMLANRLLELIVDSQLRRKLGEAGREFMKSEFSISKMVSSTDEVYQQVIRSS